MNDPNARGLVGPADIATRLGVSPTTVSAWKRRGLLPEPEILVSGVPLWFWPDIERWAKETNHPRRPQ